MPVPPGQVKPRNRAAAAATTAAQQHFFNLISFVPTGLGCSRRQMPALKRRPTFAASLPGRLPGAPLPATAHRKTTPVAAFVRTRPAAVRRRNSKKFVGGASSPAKNNRTGKCKLDTMPAHAAATRAVDQLPARRDALPYRAPDEHRTTNIQHRTTKSG